MCHGNYWGRVFACEGQVTKRSGVREEKYKTPVMRQFAFIPFIYGYVCGGYLILTRRKYGPGIYNSLFELPWSNITHRILISDFLSTLLYGYL